MEYERLKKNENSQISSTPINLTFSSSKKSKEHLINSAIASITQKDMRHFIILLKKQDMLERAYG
jgi:hypothetical protein